MAIPQTIAALGVLGQSQTFVRRISSPLMQVGNLVFDAELEVGRGGTVEFTERRIGAGVFLSDHSFALPRTFTLTGGVSGIPQPQNFGRPGAPLENVREFAGASQAKALSITNNDPRSFLRGIAGYGVSSRIQDFEERLNFTLNRREELEVVSKVFGRIRCVLLDWQAQTTPDMGDRAEYRLTLREILRANLTISQATEVGMEMVGTGGSVAPGGGGPSNAPLGTLDVVP